MSRRTRAERIQTAAAYAAIEREAEKAQKRREREDVEQVIADVLNAGKGRREDERDKL